MTKLKSTHQKKTAGLALMVVAIIINLIGQKIDLSPMLLSSMLLMFLGVLAYFTPTPEDKKIQTTIDTFSRYISKHRIDKRVKEMSSRFDNPKDFEIALLEMLVHYGEESLKAELYKLKGEPSIEPEAEPEPKMTEEERKWKDREETWVKAGFTRKLESEEAVLNEYEKRKAQAWSDFDKNEITEERLQYRLARLEEIKNELILDLKTKDSLGEGLFE